MTHHLTDPCADVPLSRLPGLRCAFHCRDNGSKPVHIVPSRSYHRCCPRLSLSVTSAPSPASFRWPISSHDLLWLRPRYGYKQRGAVTLVADRPSLFFRRSARTQQTSPEVWTYSLGSLLVLNNQVLVTAAASMTVASNFKFKDKMHQRAVHVEAVVCASARVFSSRSMIQLDASRTVAAINSTRDVPMSYHSSSLRARHSRPHCRNYFCKLSSGQSMNMTFTGFAATSANPPTIISSAGGRVS
ncbi:hypothetical protein BKA80DRAFT_253518 [Phyllosticta citrichinensis]